MILITGAGGKTGRALIRALATNESVCALVHHEGQVNRVEALGAERVVVGDLRDEAVVQSALRGIRALYHICPNMSPDEDEIGNLLIHAARENHIEHFVYHSVLHPQAEKMNHHWQKLRVEEALFESGLAFTILQPAPYMQNLLAGWNTIVEDHVIRVPYSVNSKFSFVDLHNVADAARIVLTEPGHTDAIYELAGTNPMSHVDVAEVFSRVLNEDVRAKREEIRDWRLRTVGLSAYADDNLIRMFEYYDQWGLVGNPNVLRWVLKREPTSFESFIQRSQKEYDTIR
jgi:NAD(P)H dehydrogenase (quinone)